MAATAAVQRLRGLLKIFFDKKTKIDRMHFCCAYLCSYLTNNLSYDTIYETKTKEKSQ